MENERQVNESYIGIISLTIANTLQETLKPTPIHK